MGRKRVFKVHSKKNKISMNNLICEKNTYGVIIPNNYDKETKPLFFD